MDIFFTLLINLMPLYGLIALGWVSGRFCGVDQKSLANMVLYIVMPVVSFYYVATLDFKLEYAFLPFAVFTLSSGLMLLFFELSKRIYNDKRANLLSMCAISGNTGYLGLPLVLLLFEAQWVGVYMFALAGWTLHEATVLYYVANRGNFDPKDSVRRVLKFPVLYAILAGLIVNFSGADLPSQLDDYWGYFKGVYVVIGMMILGSTLSKVDRLEVTLKFLSLTFFGKFILWPLSVLVLIWVDNNFTNWFVPEIHKILIIFAIVPPAANTTVFATKLDLNPEKAATTVLLGTLFALLYIPAILILTGFY